MDLKGNNRHDRFVSTSTSGITVVLQMIDNDDQVLIDKLIKKYNDKLIKGFTDFDIIDGLYRILCFKYQNEYQSKESTNIPQREINRSFFPHIINILFKLVDDKNDAKLLPTLLDIVVLEMVLYYNIEDIKKSLEYLFSSRETLIKETDNLSSYFSITECIIDALYLNLFIYKSTDCELKQINLLLLNEIRSWVDLIENNDWKSLISILPKMMETFNCSSVLTSTWRIILNQDYRKILSLLCGIIDDMTALTSEESVRINIHHVLDDKFWLLVSNSITSSVEYHRKQGLYVMKRTLEFLEEHQESLGTSSSTLAPFVNCQQRDHQKDLKLLCSKFILMLECLEEKQLHLVSPALSNLNSIIQSHLNHLNCGNCFNIIWLHCLFERILTHKTNAIMKTGLIALLAMNPNIFDDKLMSLLVKSLDNMFLYDNQKLDELPEIPQKLIELLLKAEKQQCDLIKRFINETARSMVSQIPLFYSAQALKTVSCKLKQVKWNIWRECEVEAAKMIIKKNFTSSSKALKSETHYSILDTCLHFTDDLLLTKIIELGELFQDDDHIYTLEFFNRMINYFDIKEIDVDVLTKLICQNCEKLCLKETGDNININSLALMIVLASKKNVKLKQSPIGKALNEVFDLIIGADVRSYSDISISMRVMELIGCLIRMTDCLSNTSEIDLIIPYLDSVRKLILNSLKPSKSPKSQDEAWKYINTFNCILKRFFIVDGNQFKSMKKNFIDSIMNIRFNELLDIQFYYVLHILHICNSTFFMDLTVYSKENLTKFTSFLLKTCQQKLELNSSSDSNRSGKLVSECYQLISNLIFSAFNNDNFMKTIDAKSWLLPLMNFIDNGKEFVITSIIKTLNVIVNNQKQLVMENKDTFQGILESSWIFIWDVNKSELFYSNIEAFIHFIFNPNIIAIEDFIQLSVQYTKEIITRCETIPVVKILILKKISESKLSKEHLVHFYDALLSCYLQLNPGGSYTRIEMQACEFLIRSEGSINLIKIFKFGDSSAHVNTRITAMCVMLLMEIGDKELVLKLLSKLKPYEQRRYYANSTVHKVKNRIMQMLLLFQPNFDDELASNVHDVISNLLVTESNQSSVRVMQEWLLIKIYNDKVNLRSDVWKLMDKAREIRPGSIISVASIIYHLIRLLNANEKRKYVNSAIAKLLPHCCSQNFVVRLYCQVILSKIFEMTYPKGKMLAEHKLIEETVRESLNQGNLSKNSVKLSEDFYFNTFHPVEDYDLQTIFYELPRLLNVTMDEWITPAVFKLTFYNDHDEKNLSIPIRLNNSGKLSSSLLTSGFTQKTRVPDFTAAFEEADTADSSNGTGIADVQKKLITWKSIVPSDEDLSLKEKILKDEGMIIVASLIDNMPNLGGLARTSEIFCAKELVLPSLTYISNKEFQSLSVSAEKWLTLIQVKPHDLRKYLLDKKSLGWTLIGAEQTANSVNLKEMKFNRKTVLLLGNEKSGIPANLIPLMDTCVEIPQAGVVRSLNVHVTGAICLWQYAQQHIV